MAYQIRPSAKKYKRTHAQLVAECANQVAGVFAYYADTTLTNEQVAQICSALDKILPKDFTTEGWSRAADACDAKVAEETQDN